MGIHKPQWPYTDTFDVQNLSVESTFSSDGTSKFNGPIQLEGNPGVAGQLAMSYGPSAAPEWVSFQLKEQVSAATTGTNIAGTYASNTLTLTATGIQYIDGYLLQLGDRVLLKDQTDKTQNGIYIVSVAGTIAVQTVLTRDNDADTAAKLAVAIVPVDQGIINGGTVWISTVKATDILGTTSIVFNQNTDNNTVGNLTRKPLRPTTTSHVIQNSLANRTIWRHYPSAIKDTTVVSEGFGTVTAYGTATAATWATTNLYTRTRKLTYPSAATAGAAAGYRTATASFTVGTGSALTGGGFYYSVRFGIASATETTFVAAARTFVGLSSNTAGFTNAEPSTFTNCIGVGQGAADTSWKIFWGGSAAQTPIDLGSTNFPYVTASRDNLYELTLYSPSTSNTVIYYTFTNLTTGATTSGTLSGNAGVALPAATTGLTHHSWRNNNATASAVDIDHAGLYVETEA